MFSRYLLLTVAALAPLVSAHGHASGVFIDDNYFPGPEPNSGSTGFTIREINDIDPVKGATNPDLNCGHGATTPATEVADASPGSVMRFAWVNGDNGPWIHNTGPVMTYMASCGAGGCASFNSANAEFFKISELGQQANGSWAMSELNVGLNATTSATIPTNLPAGEYLVRHELIAMQLGMSPGGAEFYPMCLQIRLGNSTTVASTSLPSGNETVTFPGGYTDTDPGILDPNIYNPGSPYTFPGPPLVSAATTDPSSGSTPPSTTSSTDAPNNAGSDPTSSTAAAPAPTGCGYANKKKRIVKRVFRRNPLVKKSVKPVKREEANFYRADYKRTNHDQPVARSRIMRGI